METGSPETVELLLRWHSGDRAALDTLLERDLPWIHNVVRRRLGRHLRAKAETQDFVQDAIVEFLRYGPRVMVSDRKQFRALLARIVENVIRGQHDWFTARRRALSRERPLPADSVLRLDAGVERGPSPSQAADQRDWEALVRLALELLEGGDREVIVLREFEQTSFGSIGAKLGVSEDAARMRFYRAVLRLSDTIQKLRRGRLDEVLGEDVDGLIDP